MTADWLIRLAYEVKEGQIVGLPNWNDDAAYAIEAKLPPNAGESDLPKMFQALLANRFHLVCHRETKTIRVRTISVAKQGLKLKPASIPFTTDPAEDRKSLLDRRRCGEIVSAAPPDNWRSALVSTEEVLRADRPLSLAVAACMA